MVVHFCILILEILQVVVDVEVRLLVLDLLELLVQVSGKDKFTMSQCHPDR